jgi:RNA polymerase sigma factor (sigma-70 family)
MNDFELLGEYAGRASEDAFTLLVNRYADLVYSAALRQAGDARDAEEITQAVFLILARKAGGMRPDTVLSGWLLRTTRFVALNARRREINRKQLEREAMNLYPAETDAAWKKIAPLLDEALVHLSEKDRAAVALRFFEKKSFKEIGRTMGLTEDGAQKRVARAVEKLRADFARRGMVLPVALITGAIVAGAVQAAPGHLAASAASTAFAGTAVTAHALAEITLSAWDAARLKLLALQGAAVALAAGLIWVTAVELNSRKAGPPVTTSRPAPVMAGVGTALPPAMPETKPAQPAGGETMRFHVVDAASQAPVTNARLTVVRTAGFLLQTTNIVATDNEGTALLSVDRAAAGDWSARIEVFQDGYVPKYVRWSEALGDSAADIPVDYTTQLTRAAEIGGVVVNEAGTPVPGARVVFTVFTASPANSSDRECLTLAPDYHVEVTDSQGRWHCNHVPKQFGQITFRICHPDYAAAQYGSAELGATTNMGLAYVAAADLRKGTAVMRVAPGAVVSGLVVDEAGFPVAGAKVTANLDRTEPTANQLTGVDGRFRFANITKLEPGGRSPNSVWFLTVQADGYSPAELELFSAPPPEEPCFVLDRGGVLRGVVADDKGQPVAGARVRVCSQVNAQRFEWSTVSDDKGKFEWLSAPASPTLYVFEARGYQTRPDVRLTADGTEQQVTLHANPPPVRFFGNVTDAETGKLLDSFTVWMSTMEPAYTGYDRLMSKRFPSRMRAIGKAGSYSFTNSGALTEYTLEVRAEGYSPAQTTGRRPLTNDTAFDFKLEKALSLSGVVQSPDGKPVGGVVAMLCTEGPRRVPMQSGPRNGGYMKVPGQFDLALSSGQHVETDAQGRFKLQGQAGVKKILVFNAAGFASVSPDQLAASPAVLLLPWGRVAGVLKIGSQPGSNQTIGLTLSEMPYDDWCGYSLFLQTRTDAEGRFSFEGVPPGDFQVSHRLNYRDGQPGPIPDSQQTSIHVRAGETTQVTLGGTGWKVIGKLKPNGGGWLIDWKLDVQWLRSKPAGPELPKRTDFASSADFLAAQQQWVEDQHSFWASAAGQEARQHQRRYVLDFATDGSFKIDDVIPGTYELSIRVSDPKAPVPGTPAGSLYKTLNSLTKEIVIPEIPAGADGTPYDLGELELN